MKCDECNMNTVSGYQYRKQRWQKPRSLCSQCYELTILRSTREITGNYVVARPKRDEFDTPEMETEE